VYSGFSEEQVRTYSELPGVALRQAFAVRKLGASTMIRKKNVASRKASQYS